MLAVLLSYLPPIVGLALIGLATYIKNPRLPVYRLFFWVVIVIAAWLTALCVADLCISQTVSLLALRVGVAVGTFIAPALLYFGVNFPVRLKPPRPYFHILVLGPAIVLSLLSFTPLIIPGVALEGNSSRPVGLNTLYTVQSLYEIVGAGIGLFLIVRKHRYVAAREKAQIRLVVAGLLVAITINIIANFVLELLNAANTYSNFIAGFSFVVFVGTTAYAMARHRLFDLRLAITRTVTFVLAIGLLSVAYSLLVLGVGVPLITGGTITLVKDQTQILFLLPPTLLAALTFHSLQQYFARKTRRLFYQDSYNTRDVLDRFSDAIISENDLARIMSQGLTVLRDAIKSVHAFFVVFDDHKVIYKSLAVERSVPQELSQLIRQAATAKDRAIVKDEMPVGGWPQLYEDEDISLVLRLGSSKHPTGYIFLGPKRNGRIYNQQDIDLLTVSSKNFAVAIENAKKYEQIAAFADTLKAEVERATANLRRANTKLKTLDALKDDFISMASHQLRSPATSVRDAIQMLGQNYLTPKERRRIIELADASSERLVSVVTDMLSVARIQAGHFTLDKAEVDLGELADRAILQASALARQKGITIHFERPRTPISLQADRSKLNEIMSNYIENAIKYSDEHTTITVTLKGEKDKVFFAVDDEGIGVPEVERKELFTKFYRSSNARRERPNGNGVGLFVVKTVAEAHGGGVYYEPLGQGSRFGFWLPW